MRGSGWLGGALAAALLCGSGAQAQYREDALEPEEIGIRDLDGTSAPRTSYAGNDVCRLCHAAAYAKWLGTRHARAYVPLRSQVAMEMGARQGVTACCPAKSGKCLSCHATAHDAPAAARGPGFRLGEGVACEKCHGPGADHVAAMEGDGGAERPDTAAGAMVARPAPASCLACHAPKPSHAALERPRFDPERAWKAIAHPRSAERPEDEMEPEELGLWHFEQPAVPAAEYVGSAACAACHPRAYAVWSAGAHARASRALRSEMGVMMGMKLDMNVVGGPSKDPRCLRCHATGHDAPAAYRRAGFRMLQGVACEKCHGPRGAHVDAMGPGGGAGGQAAGPPGPASAGDCQTCHHAKRSHEPLGRPPFDYEAAWARVAH